MKGVIYPYYTATEIENDIRNLYINIETTDLEYCKAKMIKNNPLWINIADIFKGKIRKRDITGELEGYNNGERLTRETIISNNLNAIKRIYDHNFLEQLIPVKARIIEAIDIFLYCKFKRYKLN